MHLSGLVMERAPYGDLANFIIQSGTVGKSSIALFTETSSNTSCPLAEPLAKSVTLDMTGALKYLHGRGIAHRDIKPQVCQRLSERLLLLTFGQNVLVFSLNPLITKICDFGLAKSVIAGVSRLIPRRVSDIILIMNIDTNGRWYPALCRARSAARSRQGMLWRYRRLLEPWMCDLQYVSTVCM